MHPTSKHVNQALIELDTLCSELSSNLELNSLDVFNVCKTSEPSSNLELDVLGQNHIFFNCFSKMQLFY